VTIRRLGMAAAILTTLGFSCYNEPHYARVGMSNPPGGSGSAVSPPVTSVPAAAPAPAPAPATPSATATRPDSSKGAAKRP
jgi:hypothetical protein